MIRRVGGAVALLGGAILAGGVSVPAVAFPKPVPSAREGDTKTYRAIGVIRSFGPDRAYVNIAHDEIPGYMGAMTMSFWPQRAGQLDGLSVGDRVAFEFTETEDARRLIANIQKRS